MKRIPQHPKPSLAETTGPRYWRSLDELSATPEFQEYMEREFPEGASGMDGVDRRHFMKIMAASFALGGLGFSGCRRPETHFLPYAKSPEHIIPGVPIHYASARPVRGGAIPVVVETHEARPTKIEGNPSYESFGGTTDLLTQASVLDLYDPDRASEHRSAGRSVSRAELGDLLAGIGVSHAEGKGAGLAFLAEPSTSPTRLRLVAALRESMPKSIWAEYDPTGSDGSEAVATRLFGRRSRPIYHYGKAARILSLESDFLQEGGGQLRAAREFSDGRRVEKTGGEMNRLYQIESHLTVTGGMADHRLRLPSSRMAAVAAHLAERLEVRNAVADPETEGEIGDAFEWLDACAEDLAAHRGESLVVAGPHLPDQVHALCFLINKSLGNVGETVEFVELPETGAESIETLAAAIRDDEIRTLVILEGNPVYNCAVDMDWATVQKSVETVIRLGYHADETSELADTHIAGVHYLEAWGDARTEDGTIVPIQPMIMPLFDGLTELETIGRILGLTNPDSYSLVRETFGERVPVTDEFTRADADRVFQKFLHDGLIEGTQYPRIERPIQSGKAEDMAGRIRLPKAPDRENLEARFVADYTVDDGRFANNGWLQECPDPISKLTWDNAVLISPRLADELGIEPGRSMVQVARKDPNPGEDGRLRAPVVEVAIGGRTVRGPAVIQPGLDNYTIVLPLGYGRSRTGRVGTGAGFNAYSVRGSGNLHTASGATLSLTGETYVVANTQEHWSMEGRAIVREANLDDYHAHPEFVDHLGMESHTPPVYGKDKNLPLSEQVVDTPKGNSLYEHPVFDGTHQWGMTIDLNTCTGCNACVVACQSENNIPIVGRDQVRRGREMHWIRLDRYYSSGSTDNTKIPEDPQISIQPINCQQCENATCEMVCPVNATVHDSEGLNVMAYNRCVGTRYCANNCPYKVRRFNFFDYQQRELDKLYQGPLGPKGMPELLQMAQNPDVSIRMRGVMEKCTYCTQRIQKAKIDRKVQAQDSPDVEVPDGTFQVACEQVCPTRSIVFGNVLDSESHVSKMKESSRDYSLLGYLNTRPRTTYLAKLRNPNPEMPDSNSMPLSRVEYENKNHVGAPGEEHGGAGDHGDHEIETDGGRHG
ncbi:MAG: hydrogenase [Verrucomicrobia bacterium]|nr:MAG: hydrogenase [Verrucomicrobiota bacterium]